MADVFTETAPPAKAQAHGENAEHPGQPAEKPGDKGVNDGANQGAREDGWPTFTELLRPLQQGLDTLQDGLRTINKHLEIASATRELHSSLDRFHDPSLEPGSLDLAKDLGRAILAGDSKTVQSLLNQHKGTDKWASALEHLDEECERRGIFVNWNEKENKLQRLRPPSIYVRGPAGVALDFKAGEEAPAISGVKHKDGPIPRGHVGPYWDIKQVERDASEAARDLAKTMIDRLRAHTNGIDSARTSLELRNALDLMQPDGKPPQPDRTTALVKSLLDKTWLPWCAPCEVALMATRSINSQKGSRRTLKR
jgi:hypothetical protein